MWSKREHLEAPLPSAWACRLRRNTRKINVFLPFSLRKSRKLNVFTYFCLLENRARRLWQISQHVNLGPKIQAFAPADFRRPFFACISLQTYEEKIYPGLLQCSKKAYSFITELFEFRFFLDSNRSRTRPETDQSRSVQRQLRSAKGPNEAQLGQPSAPKAKISAALQPGKGL